MAMSGITVSDDCVKAFTKQKMKKQLSIVCYRISDDKKNIIADRMIGKDGEETDSIEYESKTNLPPNELFDKLKSLMKEDQCMYFTHDCKYTAKSGGINEKICFITWAPDNAKIKDKMLLAASKETLKKALVGISLERQASDLGDMGEYSEFEAAVAQS